MICFTNVSLLLNNKLILSDISVTIPDDCKTVVIGKSGCGKTVFMKTLEGLHRPQSGDITIDGVSILDTGKNVRPQILQKVAMLFQYAALLDSFTVFQNVALPLYESKSLDSNAIHAKVMEILNFVGLMESSQLYPSELSGGMRKRIGLARALITDPKYIILDEPTTGLDPFTSNEVMTFLKHIIEVKKVVPITITHDPYCINNLGDYIIIIEQGKLLFNGYIHELLNLKASYILDFYNSFFLI